MTVVDKASRGAIFIPVKDEHITAKHAALLFRKHVFSRGWGLPLKLISDRDPRFTSEFWKTLQSICGSKLAMSSSHHPQSDATSEIVHRELNDFIRNSAGSLRCRWDEYVDLLEFAHNYHISASTGFSPFVFIYGCEPRTFSSLVEADICRLTDGEPDLATFLRMKSLVLATAARNVVAAQARQKHYYDLRRSPNPSYKVGDFVYVNSEHYRITLAPKTEDRWIGPFEVVEVIGELDYRLILPSYLNYHDVFHASVLKSFVPPTVYVHPPPSIPVANAPLNIEVILAHKRGRGRGGPLSFSVKYVDQPVSALPIWLKDEEARTLSPEVVSAYRVSNKL